MIFLKWKISKNILRLSFRIFWLREEGDDGIYILKVNDVGNGAHDAGGDKEPAGENDGGIFVQEDEKAENEGNEREKKGDEPVFDGGGAEFY